MKAFAEYMKGVSYIVLRAEVANPEDEYSKRFRYSFKFEIFKGKLKIRATSEFSDRSDYAFYDGNTITSYSEYAAKFVSCALDTVGMTREYLEGVKYALLRGKGE